jgi:[NiFe] hydrogenase assembly HybE family chaperone
MTEGLGPPTAALEAAFDEAHRRMHDLPFVNGALRVEAVGFAPWQDHWLGVLVTPWFINLVLLPRLRERWRELRVGDSTSYGFPAGVYEFIGGYHERVGDFQSCSLFSPVLEFQDQEAARLTARCALDALFDEANRQKAIPDVPAAAPAAQPQSAPAAAGAGSTEADGAGRAPVRPMSKRAFLRGEFIDADGRHRG